MWQHTIKKSSNRDVLAMGLSGDINIVATIFESLKDSNNRNETNRFTGLLDTLKLYSEDKDKYLRESFPRRVEKYGIGEMKRKMDILLEKFGTKRQTSSTQELFLLAEQVKEEKTPEKINEFLSLAGKHWKIVERDKDLRQLKRELQQLSRGSVLSFTSGNPSKSLLEKFAKIIEGELHWLGVKGGAWVIHYPNLSVGEWMKNWNALFFDEERNIDFRTEGKGGKLSPTSIRNYSQEFERLSEIKDGKKFINILNPILVELKSYSPTIQGAGVSQSLPLPDPTFYEVSRFTLEDLREYLEIINKVQNINTSLLLPTGDLKIDVGGETQIQGIGKLKELIFSTKSGGKLRNNPYLSILLSAIGGKDWFSELINQTKATEIIDNKKMENLLLEDAMKAREDRVDRSSIFDISLEGSPETEREFKQWIRGQIDVGEVQRIGAEVLESTVSPKVMRILDDSIEKIGVEQLLSRGVLKKYNSIDFKEKKVGSVIRFSIIDGENEFSPTDIKELIKRIRLNTNLETKEGEDPVDIIGVEMSVVDLLQSTKFTQLMLSNNLVKTSKQELGGVSLSQLGPEKLVAFLAKLDSLLGYGEGAGSVADYYEKIDDSNDIKKKKALAEELEEKIGKRIGGYKEGLIYAFEDRLRNIITTKGVGDSRGQLPKKLLDRLVDTGLVTEVGA